MIVKKLDEFRFRLDSSRVKVYSNSRMMDIMKGDETLKQALNASHLPGLVEDVIVMPDGHEGYGFPVGGVAAFDADDGIISPGAVGYDINCGVRVILTSLRHSEIKGSIGHLLDSLFSNVPSGVGSKNNIGFEEADLRRVSEEGIDYLIEKGYGFDSDPKFIEEGGFMEGADFGAVSSFAKKRGLNQIGTLGAGNHFLELQRVEQLFDERTAEAFGLFMDQVVVMVHTGSRGFGHQICTDYLMELAEYRSRNGIELEDPELSYAYAGSKEAENYIKAMKCAVNYAFSNRQLITDSVRKSFEKVFGKSADEMGMRVLYDVAHNIVKLEEHKVGGSKKKLYVHRKGATRSLPKDSKDVPKSYISFGQPVLIPGSMGTASYILCGAEGALDETFGSACHGAGRVMSRHRALREIPQSRTFESMEKKGIELRIKSRKLVSEEAEWVYKDIDDVVKVVSGAGLASLVSRNVPIGVVKG